jgi:hypothetical protein
VRSGRLVAALLAFAGLLTAVACTGGSQPGARSSADPVTWTGAGPSPRSRLVASGGRVVYISGAGSNAQVVALDSRDGTVAWSKAAGTVDAQPVLLADGDHVIVIAEGGFALQSLAGLDGAVRWRTPLPSPVVSNPYRCGDDVCAVIGSSSVAAGVVQIARDDGTLRDTGRAVGPTVVAVDGDQMLSLIGSDLVLSRRHGTQEMWRAPLSTLFGGTAIDPAARWRGWPGRNGAWVVWQAPPGGQQGVATGIADGTPQWDIFATQPCAFADDDTVRAGHPEFPVLLCFGTPTRSIIGVDPVTGAGTWQLDDPAIDGPDAATVVRTSDRSWLLHSSTDDIEVDVVEGPRKPGVDVIGGWCGQPHAFPCTLTGGIIPDPNPVPAFGGATVNGVNVWVLNDEIHAFRPA